MKNTCTFFILCFLILNGKVNAQWLTTGNVLFGGEKLGSLNNQPLDFFTNNTARMRLQNTTGFLGIGVPAPTDILHIHDGNNSVLHVTNGGTGNTALAGVKFGLLNNTLHLVIAQQSTNPLSRMYFTTNGAPAAANAKMTITNNGSVGIGNGFNNPNNLLDVNGGDIDINTPSRTYMIADSTVLCTKANSSNIIVGVGAGNSHGFNQPSENTYVGYRSGFLGNGCFFLACSPFPNTRNTLIGAYAGYNNAASGATYIGYAAGFTHNGLSTGNTFVGYEAGTLTQGTSNDNVMVGALAGKGNTTGDNNVFLGIASGSNSTTGKFNSFMGCNTGLNNTSFNNNTYMGALAGGKSSGDDNVFAGFQTGNQGVGNKNVVLGNNAMITPTLSNENVTIGYNAAPAGDKNDFNVFIGSQSVPAITTSSLNAMIGYKTAFTQTAGISNAYLGELTGNNVLGGNNNTFIGAKADVTTANSTTVINSAAIGANAKVTNANHMILGDNNVNVGIGLSADPAGPQKKLHIKDAVVAGPSNPNPSIAYPTFGASGLRFTNLTAVTPTVVNPGLGVLTVDSVGNVIYVRDTLAGGGSLFGGVCGTTPQGLTSDWEIPLKGFNYIFSGQGLPLTGNNVGIGTSCTPQAKLEVLQSSGSTLGSTGILVTNTDPASYFANVIGIQSMVNNTNAGCVRIAGWFEADNGPACGGSIINQAIYVPQNGGAVTIGYPAPTISISQLLQVNGSALFGSVLYPSDISLKNTITTIPNSLEQIKKLRPVTFKWNTVSDTGMAGLHAGFIAQEIDTVIPQVVRTNGSGVKTVAYAEIIPYLVSAIQTQQKTIDSLMTKASKQDSINSAVQAQIAALTSSVTSCCSSSAIRSTTPSEQNQLSVNLTDKDIIVLNQNVPNPFAEQTTITYNVPEKYGYAQMIFSTIDGRILKTVDITKKGKGTVTVFSNDLSSGMYTYSLIVDGKTFDTKKMVKSE